MGDFSKMIELLRAGRSTLSPSQLARLVMEEAGGEAGQFFLINVLDEAFPEIPFRVIIRAGRWHQVCQDGMSDAEFDALLSPWLGRDG